MPQKSRTVLTDCLICEAKVAAEVVGGYEHLDSADEGPPQRTSLAKCPHCHQPLLVGEECIGSQGDSDFWDSPYRLYPPKDRRLDRRVPREVRLAVDEARSCLRAKAFTASLVMCRKALEGICDDLGEKKGTLEARLARLRDSGALDPRLHEWADSLRLVGNAAAHDVHAEVSRDDAGDLLDLAEAIADYVYTFRARFTEFKQRRSGSTE